MGDRAFTTSVESVPVLFRRKEMLSNFKIRFRTFLLIKVIVRAGSSDPESPIRYAALPEQ